MTLDKCVEQEYTVLRYEYFTQYYLQLWKRSVYTMKKLYSAPALECLAFFSASPIGAEEDYIPGEDGSFGWNDGELGWT